MTTATARHVMAPDGVELYAAERGAPSAKAPVLCLPGLTRNSRDFDSIADHLAQDRLVLAADLRGRGRSGRDPSAQTYRLDVYVDDVLRLLDGLELERVAVIGTSLGGRVATHVAERAPDRLIGVVLNDIGPDLAPEGALRIASYAGKLGPVGSWDDAVAQTRLVNEVTAPGLTDDQWEAIARQRYVELPDGAVVIDHDPNLAAGPLVDADHWKAFASLVGIPVLLLVGELTDLLAPETVDAMRVVHEAMEVVTVPGRGHAPMLDEPIARDAIVRFLDRV